MTIEPKPTEYRGVAFKSRLEARWGVFLTSLNWDWVYEPITWELDNGWTYTPDFLAHPIALPDLSIYIEVKPVVPTPAYINTLGRYGKRLYIVWGNFFDIPINVCGVNASGSITPLSVFGPRYWHHYKVASNYRFDIGEQSVKPTKRTRRKSVRPESSRTRSKGRRRRR